MQASDMAHLLLYKHILVRTFYQMFLSDQILLGAQI